MSDPRSRSRARRAAGAFTLIELIVVVAVLASIAGLAVATLSGTQEQVTRDLALNELSEVRKAILQFKADTGFLPKRGPFNLASRAPDGGQVVLTGLQTEAWFDAPANLSQLFECPLPTGHPLATWNPDRRRGWRGPYLQRDGEGLVAVSDGLDAHGTTTWVAGTPLPAFPAVADPFTRPADPDLGFTWTTWSGVVLERHGRPILLLDVDPEGTGPGDDVVAGVNRVTQRARVVSLGPDGEFAPVGSSTEIDAGACVAGDDLGLFLLR